MAEAAGTDGYEEAVLTRWRSPAAAWKEEMNDQMEVSMNAGKGKEGMGLTALVADMNGGMRLIVLPEQEYGVNATREMLEMFISGEPRFEEWKGRRFSKDATILERPDDHQIAAKREGNVITIITPWLWNRIIVDAGLCGGDVL